jgi:two-component system LytT family response regulator
MRVLIVDDEAPARARLRRLLDSHPSVEIVGEARDGPEALQRAAELAPDAVFLDVQMPGVSGLDVAASLADPAPAIVFVTAFDQYAVSAFDAAATDYLLKPVEPERLARALKRIRARGTEASAARRGPGQAPPAQLLIPDRGRTHVVPVVDIQWLEAADNYVAVHAGTRAPLMRRTLAGLLEDLGGGFVRTHRGAAVGLAHVVRLETRERGDATVVLRDGSQVPCSRQYRPALVARLSHTDG